MMMTYGCDWDVSIDEEAIVSQQQFLAICAPTLQASLGLQWLPVRFANDNLPEWLNVAK